MDANLVVKYAVMIITMDIFKCYISSEHIALSLKKPGVNIKLGNQQIKSTVLDAI